MASLLVAHSVLLLLIVFVRPFAVAVVLQSQSVEPLVQVLQPAHFWIENVALLLKTMKISEEIEHTLCTSCWHWLWFLQTHKTDKVTTTHQMQAIKTGYYQHMHFDRLAAEEMRQNAE